MAYQVQLRGGPLAESDAFTGAPKEVTVNTTDWSLRVHDGVTLGGHPIVGATEPPPPSGGGVTVYDRTNIPVYEALYLSIGTGNPEAAEADFVDIYAFADFINNISIRDHVLIYGYFKEPGVVTLTRPVFFTNASTYGNIMLAGAGVDGIGTNETSPWNDGIYLKITEILFQQAVAEEYPYIYDVKVSSVGGLFIGAICAILEDGVASLPISTDMMGTYKIVDINSTTNVVRLGGYINNLNLTAPIYGMNLGMRVNRTVIQGGGPNHLIISGRLGNYAYDGGLYGLSFDNCIIRAESRSAEVLLYTDTYLYGDSQLVVQHGAVYTWGDLFLSKESIYIESGTFQTMASIYIGRNRTVEEPLIQLYGLGSLASLESLRTSGEFYYLLDQFARLILLEPDIHNYGPAFTAADAINMSQLANSGSTLLVTYW